MKRDQQDDFQSFLSHDSEFKVRRPLFEQNRKRKLFQKWTKDENADYANFLELNLGQFHNHNGRRSMKFFNRMAEQLRNGRNNQQCRSHHQKMMKKYKHILKVISSLKPKQKGQKKDQRVEDSTILHQNKSQQLSQCEQISVMEEKMPELILVDEQLLEQQDSNLFCFNQFPFGIAI